MPQRLQYICTFLLVIFSQSLLSAEPAKRIIALSPHAVEMLYAIGAGDRIVGTVEYADYPAAAKQIRRIGNFSGLQIEQILALKPDLVVAWRSGNRTEDLDKLESLGLSVFYTHPKNIDGIFNDMEKLGEFTGLQNNTHQVVDSLKREYQTIKKQYQTKAKVKVFYQLWHDPLRTVGPDSWVGSLIADCRGQNIFYDTDNDYPQVALEAVLKKNPQVIIIPHHSGKVGAKTQIWKDWQVISAVKNEQVTTLNGDYLHRFGPRAVEGLSRLCNAIDKARKP